jgi:glutaredoxin-related protein
MGDKIICYSIGCPQCLVLERKLQQKNINFELVSDRDVMMEKGFKSAPILEVNGVAKNFKEAIKWIGEQ